MGYSVRNMMLMQEKTISIGLLLFILFLLSPAWAGEKEATAANTGAPEGKQHENIFLVNAYRYEPGDSGGNVDIGQSLCGTRCNALSADYENYLRPPGWRIIRIAKDKEVTVDLDNPFIGGHCICIADEYIVKVNELYMSK